MAHKWDRYTNAVKDLYLASWLSHLATWPLGHANMLTLTLTMACDAINLPGLLIGRICNGKILCPLQESFSIVKQLVKRNSTNCIMGTIMGTELSNPPLLSWAPKRERIKDGKHLRNLLLLKSFNLKHISTWGGWACLGICKVCQI